MPVSHSLTPAFLEAISYDASDVAILHKLGECRGRQVLFSRQRPEVLTALRQDALIESTESSNRLEGITADRGRLEQLVHHGNAPRDRSEREIAGYRDALNLIHESAHEMPFSINVIRQLHSMLFRYMPSGGGDWKSTDNRIVERNEAGDVVRVRFEAEPAVSTPAAMRSLVDLHAQARIDYEPLLITPLAVLDFLCIHPFIEGNGRIARLLTLQLLYHHDYLVGRYISLERIFEQSKESYYDTLEASSKGWHEGRHDVGPWARYFWGVLLSAYREFEERVGDVERKRGSKSQQVRAAVSRRLTPFRISELERDCPGISRDTIRVVLRKMKEEGRVTVEGHGRGARWRQIDAEAAEP